MKRRRQSGFSLIEVIFAIVILGIGIIGVLGLLVTGLQNANMARNMTAAAVDAQSLAGRVVAEADAGGKRVFMERISNGAEWIHTPAASPDPVQIDPARDMYWSCRAARRPMDPVDPTQDVAGAPDFPQGLYQIVIFVYRSWKPGSAKEPVGVYTTMITVDN